MKEQGVNFNTMSTSSAIRYCKENASEYKRGFYLKDEDGEARYQELIEGLETGLIKPKELPGRGVEPSYY